MGTSHEVEYEADKLYTQYRTFDRAICAAQRSIATATAIDQTVFWSKVIVLLAEAKKLLGL